MLRACLLFCGAPETLVVSYFLCCETRLVNTAIIMLKWLWDGLDKPMRNVASLIKTSVLKFEQLDAMCTVTNTGTVAP